MKIKKKLQIVKKMNEIEVKVIEINKEEVIKKLNSLNAKKIFEGEVITLFFDDEEKTFSKKKQSIRLRKKGKSYLTVKKAEKLGFARSAEETEVEVSDFDATKKILESIGLISRDIPKKFRTSYKLNDCLIEIDEYEEIPVFLEIEAENEEKIKEAISFLELDEEKVRTWNGFDLFKHYGKEL
jgi:adenylate cyclase class 2